MFRKIVLLLALTGFSLASLSSVTLAQDQKVLASGLNSPRYISYGSDGTLYIAEAGKGGNESGTGPYGPVKANAATGIGIGETGQISAVTADGTKTALISSLYSMNIGFGQVYGTMAVEATDDSYWVVLGLGPTQVADGKNVDALVQYNRSDLSVKQVIDLAAFENTNNPDQNPDDLVSNPSDIAIADDGKVYITDASANDLLTWTAKDGLKVFAAWPVQGNDTALVPTSVALGPDGDVYVSFLTGYPFEPESSRIEVYNPDGTLKKTYSNLSFVTGLVVAKDGTIFASQFASSYDDQGWVANSGSVVKVADDGLTIVADSLNFPYGMALSPDGNLAVVVDSFNTPADSGRIIALNVGLES